MEKQEKSVNKHLYKILIYVLKYIPFILALMETVFVVLNYYELPHYYLNVFGGFSICFIITLYLQSYIFQFCSWHRVPIHYVLLSNIIALIDDIVKIPLSDLNMMRMYFVLLVMFTMLFIYLKIKCNKDS